MTRAVTWDIKTKQTGKAVKGVSGFKRTLQISSSEGESAAGELPSGPRFESVLGSLTSAQKALAEFLEVDEDLLAGAGIGNRASQEDRASQQEMDAWIDNLPGDEVTEVLKQLLEGKGQQAERTLKNRFVAWRRGLRGDGGESQRRTISELLVNTETAEKIRLEKQKREERQREIKRRKEREAFLRNLSEDFPKAWKSVLRTVERGSGSAYDEACRALVDLSKAYVLHASKKRF